MSAWHGGMKLSGAALRENGNGAEPRGGRLWSRHLPGASTLPDMPKQTTGMEKITSSILPAPRVITGSCACMAVNPDGDEGPCRLRDVGVYTPALTLQQHVHQDEVLRYSSPQAYHSFGKEQYEREFPVLPVPGIYARVRARLLDPQQVWRTFSGKPGIQTVAVRVSRGVSAFSRRVVDVSRRGVGLVSVLVPDVCKTQASALFTIVDKRVFVHLSSIVLHARELFTEKFRKLRSGGRHLANRVLHARNGNTDTWCGLPIRRSQAREITRRLNLPVTGPTIEIVESIRRALLRKDRDPLRGVPLAFIAHLKAMLAPSDMHPPPDFPLPLVQALIGLPAADDHGSDDPADYATPRPSRASEHDPTEGDEEEDGESGSTEPRPPRPPPPPPIPLAPPPPHAMVACPPPPPPGPGGGAIVVPGRFGVRAATMLPTAPSGLGEGPHTDDATLPDRPPLGVFPSWDLDILAPFAQTTVFVGVRGKCPGKGDGLESLLQHRPLEEELDPAQIISEVRRCVGVRGSRLFCDSKSLSVHVAPPLSLFKCVTASVLTVAAAGAFVSTTCLGLKFISALFPPLPSPAIHFCTEIASRSLKLAPGDLCSLVRGLAPGLYVRKTPVCVWAGRILVSAAVAAVACTWRAFMKLWAWALDPGAPKYDCVVVHLSNDLRWGPNTDFTTTLDANRRGVQPSRCVLGTFDADRYCDGKWVTSCVDQPVNLTLAAYYISLASRNSRLTSDCLTTTFDLESALTALAPNYLVTSSGDPAEATNAVVLACACIRQRMRSSFRYGSPPGSAPGGLSPS